MKALSGVHATTNSVRWVRGDHSKYPLGLEAVTKIVEGTGRFRRHVVMVVEGVIEDGWMAQEGWAARIDQWIRDHEVR